jgi:hypothetical protein
MEEEKKEEAEASSFSCSFSFFHHVVTNKQTTTNTHTHTHKSTYQALHHAGTGRGDEDLHLLLVHLRNELVNDSKAR